MKVRNAAPKDIGQINALLFQVNNVHADGRDDIFIHGKKKYTDDELAEILLDDSRPILVAVDENDIALGYAFCILQEAEGDNLKPIKTLYVDDLCVLEDSRGKGIGTLLYENVKELAKQMGCYHVTLNVWCLNSGAMKFYEKCGLKPLKVTMEDIL